MPEEIDEGSELHADKGSQVEELDRLDDRNGDQQADQQNGRDERKVRVVCPFFFGENISV